MSMSRLKPFSSSRLPCGCVKGRLRGSVLKLFLVLGCIKLFDFFHGLPSLGRDEYRRSPANTQDWAL
jgi:hypothetical protein